MGARARLLDGGPPLTRCRSKSVRVRDVQNCEVLLLDRSSTVGISRARNCKIFIGA